MADGFITKAIKRIQRTPKIPLEKKSRAKACARNSTAWNIIWRIWPRRSMSLPSIRQPLFRSIDLAISRAQLGARRRDAKSPPMAEFIFRIRSVYFIRRSREYLGFRHYGDEYKVMGFAPYGRLRFSTPCGRLCAWPRTAALSSI
jgi:hypothetical protein